MQPSAAAKALGRWLVLRHQALPLAEALPGLRVEPGFFDALVGRWEGDDLEVYALLGDPGSDPYEAGRRGETLRSALEASAAAVPGRLRAAVHCVTEEAARAQRLREALMGHADGHFLSKVLVGRGVLCLEDGSSAYSGRAAMTPDSQALSAALAEPKALPDEDEAQRSLGQREREARGLSRRLMSTRVPMTWLLIGLNSAVFGVQLWLAHRLQAGGLEAGDAEYMALAQLGANYRTAVMGDGEWWRLLAAAFLHVGAFHLAMNMAALYGIGRVCEQLMGPWRLAAFYLSAAVISSFTSTVFQTSGAISAGASGAILGLVGLLMAPRWRRDPRFPQSLALRLHHWLLQPVALTLGAGLALQALGMPFQFDNWAHIGGLCWGLALGYLFPPILVRPLERQG